ncbi:MFS transporter [Aspergillus sclerotioniger CBS 115572]|uniref:MFS transporter n=1 Tax=Aspergillus sclerotioniger CBS 115572 TaxID=1450535 RepID=A0A317WV99_9EURO|nr:MFS transporter [Aspergillus sclerotioniger CBS 115572]PWY90286.1 MFS transporter [Aspergillus sclerotioniger CBS 115572]
MLMSHTSGSSLNPCHWAPVRKELLFATIILGSCATGSLGPLLVPGFVLVAADLQVDLTSVTLLNGSLVMALGVSAYVCSCFATCFGKRPVYLSTAMLVLVSCCWAAASKSYSSLIASRVFQGLGMGGFFALAGTSSINDVFLVHERGLRVGLWNFAVITSVNVTPVISGYVISSLSWRWCFWLEAILFGVLLAAVIFCFPETTVFHDDHVSPAVDGTPDNESLSQKEMSPVGSSHEVGGLTTSQFSDEKEKCSFPIPRQRQQTNLLIALVEPLILIIHPIIAWGCIMWAVTFTWTILLGAVASQVFTAAPFNMTTVAVGNLTGIAPLIGSALGTVLGGWLCDWSSRVLSARNNNIYEPEFRLPVILIATVAMAAGAFGLAAATTHGSSIIICGVTMAILNFAVGMGCTGIVAYTNDVCGDRAGDGFGLAMIVKSAFAFGLSFVYNQFLTRSGPMVLFSTFGAVSLGVMLTTIPLYFYGKRIRAWSETHDLLHRGR